MATYRDQAVVLRSKTIRDADRHYVLFTRERGKVTVLAKGARKGKGKLGPHLSHFGVVDVMVAKGRVIDRLAGASLVQPHKGIILSLSRTALAQGFLLAVDALVRRDLPDERLYGLVCEFLDAIESGPEPMEGERGLAFDAGIARLFDLLGHGIELQECVRCRSTLVPEGNALNLHRGGMECASCRDPLATPISAETIKALRFFRSESVGMTAVLRLPLSVRREVGFVTDLLLSTQIENRFHALKYMKAVG
ncbi:MAG: hypothetical protein RLZZ324_711 [Candidatus Parcubacteria bacterium]|jgi:DNA repair protein RecO (recombination protein O)